MVWFLLKLKGMRSVYSNDNISNCILPFIRHNVYVCVRMYVCVRACVYVSRACMFMYMYVFIRACACMCGCVVLFKIECRQ